MLLLGRMVVMARDVNGVGCGNVYETSGSTVMTAPLYVSVQPYECLHRSRLDERQAFRKIEIPNSQSHKVHVGITN